MGRESDAAAYLRLLGPIALVREGEPDVEFSPMQRRILARLALDAPRTVPVDALARTTWDDALPPSARQALQNQISRMRQAAGQDIVTTVGEGYRLAVPVDAALLRDEAAAAERLLTAGDAQEAFDTADRAVSRWLGPALADVEPFDGSALYRQVVDAARTSAEDVRLEAAIALGRRAWSLTEAERLAGASPLDERRAASRARALALSGRRADALAALTDIRRALRTELGVEPGPDIVAAEAEILRVGTAVSSDGRARESPPPLVGRTDELRAALQAVAQRQPVAVRGERGSGVSRLLFEARTRLITLGVKVVLVRAEEHPSSATSLVEELLSELGSSPGAAQSALATFAEVAAGIDADHPTVFIIDDVQFLGPSSWQAIRAVAEAPYGGLILGGHGKYLELAGQVEVELAPLDPIAIGAMARHWGVSEEAALAEIVEASGGNPTAARVVAQALRARPVGGHGSAPVTELPEFSHFVAQLVGDRDVDRRHDLQLAAVAGDGYPREALDRVTWTHRPVPPSDLVEVDANGALRFRHGAVRAYVYQTLPRGVALDMHYALGVAAREIAAPAGTVARHLVASAELDGDAAIEAARAAARDATVLGAHADAAHWLEQALAVDLTDDPARTIELRIEHADALRLSGDPAHLEALVSATEQALTHGDETLVAAAGFALLQLGGSSPAGELDDGLGALARRVITAISDPQLRAPVQAAASLAWSMTGHADTARSLFDEAEAAAQDIAARLRVLPFAYLAVGRPGDLARRESLAKELVALSDLAGEPVPAWEGAHLQFSVALQRGDGAGAREALRRMESLISQAGDVGRRWSVLYCSATIAHIDGRIEEAESLASQAFAMFAPVSAERAAAAYYAQLLPLKIDQGRLAELAPIVLAMVSDQPGVTAWHAAAALVLADGGDPEAARHHAERALDLAQDDFTWLAAHVVGGRAAALVGDAALVGRYRERLEPWADLVCWQGTCSYGPVAAVLALLAEAAGASEAADYAATAAQLAASLRQSAS